MRKQEVFSTLHIKKCLELHCYVFGPMNQLKQPLSLSVSNMISYPKRQNLDSFKLKEFADDSFKFDGNGSKFLQKDRKDCFGTGGGCGGVNATER